MLAVVGSFLGVIKRAFDSTRRVPLFVWIYLTVILYLYRRMTRDFLGMGTVKKRIHGKLQVELTKEEEALCDDIIDPKDLTTTFAQIGGLERAKKLLEEHVVWPFQHPELFPVGSLRSHPTGVLLYGPPGTGKTLLARALAKEINGYFLNVRVEKLFTKWVGDSEKLASAVFSLAHKLGSCVIFVDEVDALLSSRCDTDSTVYTHAKTIFLTQWDGIVQSSGTQSRVLVVGATNRPKVLDEAIIRRMPIRVEVPLPDTASRMQILSIILEKELEENPNADRITQAIAKRTEGYSGSDLRQLCKVAVMVPLREVVKDRRAAPQSPVNAAPTALPTLKIEHFEEALRTVRSSSQF